MMHASFCIFFASGTNCVFSVWVPQCEENCRCPEGCNPFGSNRGEQHPVGTRFCLAKSSVLYLLRPLTLERGCHRTGQTVSCGSRRTDICRHGRLADIRSSGVGDAAKRRLKTETALHCRGSKRYIKPAAATRPRSPNTTTAVPTTRYPGLALQFSSLCFQTDENASPSP